MNRRTFGQAGLTGLAGLVVAGRSALLAQKPAAGRSYKYVHLDVFTDTRYQGNQLLVFTEPAGLDTAAMQAMTKESNYSECTFILPPETPGTDYRVRIFTRTAETPFAGHPTIGSAFALAHTGAIKPGTTRTVFGLGVGPTNLDLEWTSGALSFAWMTQLKPTFGKAIADTAAPADALGVDAKWCPCRAARRTGLELFIVPPPHGKAVDAAIA
jgi:trans-2,3-dihydro-3-hydroxyanthranilate isomerase